MNWLQRIHWKAVGAALVTLAGVAVSPSILAIVPLKVATGLVLGGTVVQAFSKPVVKDAATDSTTGSTTGSTTVTTATPSQP